MNNNPSQNILGLLYKFEHGTYGKLNDFDPTSKLLGNSYIEFLVILI